MLTLAVDTAADIGSMALVDENGTLEVARLHAPGGFGQTLFGELEALLARQRVRLADIDLYAAATGPGSFTGVRVGLAAIKGLAEVAGKPAVGVSNLAALAELGTADLRAPIIDARRGEIFAALFDRAGLEIIPSSVLQVQTFVDLVGERNVEYISTGFDPGRPFTSVPPELAGTIAHMAIRRFISGQPCDPASIEANYVRRSDAEIFWKA
jgi:tRNA threonylcarbamoyladenosine biosynthesis protein TsaB